MDNSNNNRKNKHATIRDFEYLIFRINRRRVNSIYFRNFFLSELQNLYSQVDSLFERGDISLEYFFKINQRVRSIIETHRVSQCDGFDLEKFNSNWNSLIDKIENNTMDD